MQASVDIAGRGDVRSVHARHHLGVDDRVLRRAAERGEFHRLGCGAYVPIGMWRDLDRDARERLAVAAAHDLRRTTFIATHRSAGALLGIPFLRAWDGLVDTRVTRAAGSRTEHGHRKHGVHDLALHLIEVAGIPCTTLERTVVDIAMAMPFLDAVVAADWALANGASKSGLLETLDALAPARGAGRVRSVVDFADGSSGSPNESWSRVQIAQARLPAPVLQQPFHDARGLIGYVDFWWPEQALVGEFDGEVEYRSPELLAGRAPEQVLFEEKRREDRLRATGPRVVRWVTDDLRTRGRLAQMLVAAGLEPR